MYSGKDFAALLDIGTVARGFVYTKAIISWVFSMERGNLLALTGGIMRGNGFARSVMER